MFIGVLFDHNSLLASYLDYHQDRHIAGWEAAGLAKLGIRW
jgi:hypothetical protein